MNEQEMQQLRELVEFLKASGIAEFDMDRGEVKLRIKFAGEAAAAAPAGMNLADMMHFAAAGAAQVPAGASVAAPAAAASAPVPAVAAAAEEKLHEVKSPIVGTFYDSPSPGSPAFVQVGDVVEAGQVLCIVEAMKLMNEIESDMAGEIVRCIGTSGQPVEYGQPLFAIRPR